MTFFFLPPPCGEGGLRETRKAGGGSSAHPLRLLRSHLPRQGGGKGFIICRATLSPNDEGPGEGRSGVRAPTPRAALRGISQYGDKVQLTAYYFAALNRNFSPRDGGTLCVISGYIIA